MEDIIENFCCKLITTFSASRPDNAYWEITIMPKSGRMEEIDGSSKTIDKCLSLVLDVAAAVSSQSRSYPTRTVWDGDFLKHQGQKLE